LYRTSLQRNLLSDLQCKELSIGLTSGKGKQKIVGVASKCPAFPDGFSLKAAGNITKHNPCTNRPMYCQEDPCTAIIWTYDMPRHFEAAHKQILMPEILAISTKEKELMAQKGHKH
jgi:hypothetical protein